MKLLLSIRPVYAEMILAGSKRFEFRRRIPQNEGVTTVIIYATKPVGKIVGEFSISRIHSAAPSALWSQTQKYAGISRDFFEEYFLGRDVAHAIEVSAPKRYRRPKELVEILPSGVAPQSFAYV